MAPIFDCYIGIDYSGARIPISGLKGLRVYQADRTSPPFEVLPSSGPSRYWSRCGVAKWLLNQLSQDRQTIVGIDHGFSFPLRYFETHSLPLNWVTFLDDFRIHWPTDGNQISVNSVRDGTYGNGTARRGDSHWKRRVEIKTGRAKSVFHFDVPGSVAKSTHAGLPWLRYLRGELGSRVLFWPFDGWDIPRGPSAIVEVYPALWNKSFPNENRTGDQHDAYSIAAWMHNADRDGILSEYLKLDLPPEDSRVAQIEGWILGIK